MGEIRTMITQTVMQRNQLKLEMEDWYEKYPKSHFPRMKDLILTDSTLSKLDSFYKQLWDYNNAKAYAS
jgi:hypothetical protein